MPTLVQILLTTQCVRRPILPVLLVTCLGAPAFGAAPSPYLAHANVVPNVAPAGARVADKGFVSKKWMAMKAKVTDPAWQKKFVGHKAVISGGVVVGFAIDSAMLSLGMPPLVSMFAASALPTVGQYFAQRSLSARAPNWFTAPQLREPRHLAFDFVIAGVAGAAGGTLVNLGMNKLTAELPAIAGGGGQLVAKATTKLTRSSIRWIERAVLYQRGAQVLTGSVTARAAKSATAQAGSSPTAQAGSSPTAQAGSSPTAQAGSSPTAQAGSSPTAQAGSSPTAQAGSSPTAQAGSSPTAHAGSSIDE